MKKGDDHLENYELMFELSHPERLRILETLKNKPMRMSHLSKELKLTTAEVSRHLERLRNVQLIEKKASEYHISTLGNMIIHELLNLGYLIDNREYFLGHDLSVFPEDILCLETLSRATIVQGTMKIVNLIRDITEEAENFVYILSDQPLKTAVDVNCKKAEEGLKVKIIYEESVEIPEKYLVRKGKFIELRTIEKVEIAMKINEKRGGMVLPDFNGKLDFSFALMGDDALYHHWLKGIFDMYWEKAEPV